jgi:hypothetical protein
MVLCIAALTVLKTYLKNQKLTNSCLYVVENQLGSTSNAQKSEITV